MSIRRRRRQELDIWPGFVDALSGLLIIILFVSMVFMTSQFFLSEALSGRDKTIESLNKKMAELASLLALEKVQKEQTQNRVDALSNQLRSTIEAREKLSRRATSLEKIIAMLRADTEKMKAQQARLQGERDKLLVAQKDLKGQKDKLTSDKSALEAKRASLEARVAQLLDEKQALEKERTKMVAQLAELGNARRALENRAKQLGLDKAALEKQQALLRKTKSELESERAKLIEQIAGLSRARDALKAREAALNKDKAALAAQKTKLEQQIASLTRLKAELETRVASLAQQFATLRGSRADLAKRNTVLEKDKASLEKDKAGLRLRLSEAGQKLIGQKKLTDEALAQIALLNQQIAALRRQLAAIQTALNARDVTLKDQKLKLDDLGKRLNAALASKVQELERYRSQFFGRLREVLDNRSDVKIVGDRFVFQSEVLFPSGSDQLQDGGRVQLRKLAGTLKAIAAKIPKDIDWVLRVDGHTDIRPINNERFGSNWDLSAARAVAVVQFLIKEGIPPNRLVAAGFGEFQPLDRRRTLDAYEKNRRLELKITQR